MVGAVWEPVSVSQMVEQLVGEEDETELYSHFARDKVWKERGLGDARQENTIVFNFYIMNDAQYCVLKPSASSERTLVLQAFDCSDGLP